MALEELEKRLRVLEDIEAIKQLHRKYVFCLSSRAWDDLLDCFADDATPISGSTDCAGAKRKLRSWSIMFLTS